MARLETGASIEPTYSLDLNHIFSHCHKASRDVNPERWLSLRNTTSKELRELVSQILASSESSSGHIFTGWSNTLIQKDVISEVRLLFDRLVLDELLRKRDATCTGNTSVLSEMEIAFLKFALDTFKDLFEIYAVNELGYTDIWLVFPEFDESLIENRIALCQSFLSTRGLSNSDFHYLILHRENIAHEVDEPMLHIKFGGN